MKRTLSKFARIPRLIGQRGVETVELALTLPLVLFLIFGSIDISRLVAAYSAVRTATAIGARQAVGFQRDEPQGVVTVMGNGDYFSRTITSSTFNGNISFVKGTSPAVAATRYSHSCDGVALPTVYRYELRGIAYANYLISNNSPQAPYPCDPNEETECFYCCTLRKSQDLYSDLFSLPSEHNQPFALAKFVGISCTYKVPLISSAIGLGFLDKFFTVSASAYVPVNNYAGNYYDAQ